MLATLALTPKAAWWAVWSSAVASLDPKLILVMGHTKCGAIAGATATYLANKGAEGKAMKSAGSALEGLLVGLSGVAKQAEEELGPVADQDELVSLSVRVNVFSSIDFLLKYSPSLKGACEERKLGNPGWNLTTWKQSSGVPRTLAQASGIAPL